MISVTAPKLIIFCITQLRAWIVDFSESRIELLRTLYVKESQTSVVPRLGHDIFCGHNMVSMREGTVAKVFTSISSSSIHFIS